MQWPPLQSLAFLALSAVFSCVLAAPVIPRGIHAAGPAPKALGAFIHEHPPSSPPIESHDRPSASFTAADTHTSARGAHTNDRADRSDSHNAMVDHANDLHAGKGSHDLVMKDIGEFKHWDGRIDHSKEAEKVARGQMEGLLNQGRVGKGLREVKGLDGRFAWRRHGGGR